LSLVVFTQSNFVADFLQGKCDFRQKMAVLLFEPPWGLGATYDDHQRARSGLFLLVLIERFSLGVTAEALRVIMGSKSALSFQQGPSAPKFQVEGVASTNHSYSRKTRLHDLLYSIKIWTDFFRFVTIHAIDRWTDRQTGGQIDRQNSHR